MTHELDWNQAQELHRTLLSIANTLLSGYILGYNVRFENNQLILTKSGKCLIYCIGWDDDKNEYTYGNFDKCTMNYSDILELIDIMKCKTIPSTTVGTNTNRRTNYFILAGLSILASIFVYRKYR